MKNKALFLRWVLLFSLIVVGVGISLTLGSLNYVYNSDITKLSFVIFGFFTIMTLWCGRLTWKTNNAIEALDSKDKEKEKMELKLMRVRSRHLKHIAALCQALGLIGTFAGFLIIFHGLYDIEKVDPESIKKTIQQLAVGGSTAFLTTIIGLACSQLLRTQHHNVLQTISEELVRRGGDG